MEHRRWIALALFSVWAGWASGQAAAPPPPADYRAELRYRIRAPRNQRIEQFDDMLRQLKAAGLKFNAPADDHAFDANAERLTGVLPSHAVQAVAAVPNIRTLVLMPVGYEMPADETPVMIRVTIQGGLAKDRQMLLHDQVQSQLAKLGFVAKVGYDHRGQTQLFGALPASQVAELVSDLRHQPGGWLAAEKDAGQLPEPLRNIDPVRIVEVIPENAAMPITADANAPVVPDELLKLSPDLRELLAQAGADRALTRLEVVLYDPLQPNLPTWRAWLQSAGTLTIEGQLGQTVSIYGPAGVARQLARLPQVATIRLPARATVGIPAGDPVPQGNVLAMTGLQSLNALGARGNGITVAVIDDDWSGVQRFLGRSLPANTRIVDLTAERSPTLEPDPIAADRPGRGTLSALAVALAAPQANLILVRVDPAAAYQVATVARFIAGDSFRSEAMLVRHAELMIDNQAILQKREAINDERRVLSDNFDADEATQKRRIDLQKQLALQLKLEEDYSNRLARFTALEKGLVELKAAHVVACNELWNTGYATNGTGALAVYLDGPARLSDRPGRLGSVVWLQAAGDTNGQTWAAPAWDADGNGVLEFAQRSTPLPVGKWTRELNFLGWQPNNGAWTPDLPAGAKVRITLQWTEAHDGDIRVTNEQYRTPLSDLRPVVLLQRDPDAKKIAADDLVVVARPAPLAQLIGRTTNSATFEQSVEFAVKQPGRYAVRLEGRPAGYTSPADRELPPAARQLGEVFPRLFVESNLRERGQPVLIDFRTVAGGAATPSDANAVVAVGAANLAGEPQRYSAHGSAPMLALLARPTVIAFDELTIGNRAIRGTAASTGLAAGMVAAMLSGGAPASSNLRWLNVPPGGLLGVPPVWLEQKSRNVASQSGAAYPSYQAELAEPYNR